MSEKEYYESDLIKDSNIIFSDEDTDDLSEEDIDTNALEILKYNNAQDILFEMKANIEIWCEDNWVDILNQNLIDICDMNNKIYF